MESPRQEITDNIRASITYVVSVGSHTIANRYIRLLSPGPFHNLILTT